MLLLKKEIFLNFSTVKIFNYFCKKYRMSTILNNFFKIKSTLPDYVKLVVVSKTHSANKILELYNAGHKIFGENKVQEIKEKKELLPDDIEWHMIGHLQSNKVKYIAPYISLIHSVDSLSLLKIINKEAIKNNRIIECLLQLKIAKEETKYGLSYVELIELLSSSDYKELKNIRIIGLMSMATNTDDQSIIKSEYKYFSETFDKIKNMFFKEDITFKEKSIGMSNDYKIALDYGATIIRIGTLIFGDRT